MRKISSFVVGWFVLLLVNSVVLAQPNLDVQQVADGMKKSQEALSNYAWQSRVSVSVDGEEQKVDLYQVRYNMSGELEKTRMGGEADEKKVRGPIRRSVAKSKKKKVHEFTEYLGKTVESYLWPESLSKALTTSFVRAEGGAVTLISKDVVQDGDSVEISLVEATK